MAKCSVLWESQTNPSGAPIAPTGVIRTPDRGSPGNLYNEPQSRTQYAVHM